MNKIAKASIATAAGVALLLGGAGTFATWNSSAAAGSASIVAGNLVVGAGTTGVWTANGGTTSIDLETYRIVPGDVLTYTKTMPIAAKGDSLQATLALTEGAITAATPVTAANQNLADYLEATADLTVTGTAVVETGPDTNTFTVIPGAAGTAEDVTVTVTITFPDGDAAVDNTMKNGAVNLSAFSVSLTQATS